MDHIHKVEMFIFNHQFGFSALPIGRASNGEDRLTEESLKTMSRYRKITTICCAAVFALGLAACGGGDDGISVADRDAAVAAEQAKTDALQMEINALRAQLGLDPEDDPAASIQALQDEVDRLKGEVQAAADKDRMEQEDADRMAAAKTGKDLHAALDGPGADTDANNPLANAKAALSATALTVNAVENAGTFTGDPDGEEGVDLKAGDSADPLGDWAGTHYANTDAETKVENAAVVYNNKGPGRSQSFTAAGIMVAPRGASAPAIAGYVTLDGVGTVGDAQLRNIMAAAFTHSATQDHAYDAVNDAAFTTRGTYAGAPGEYRCTGDCSSTNDGKGSPTTLGGTWHFKPDAGTSAMTHQPDAGYLYYGWWVSKDKDGDPTAASVFTGEVGTITPLASGTNSPEDLAGSATYSGHAAGKFALDYSKNKLIDGDGDGGHFTADVMLSAKFGENNAPNNGGISGTIDNFMANGESVDWSVALHRATWGTAGMFATPATDVDATKADERLGTTWSIGGTASDRSGTWSGTMYDEMPGNTDDSPPGDGSTVPTTATGTFYSEYGNVGRMVGAFGANKQ